MRYYPALNALRNGENISVQGHLVKWNGKTGDDLKPGDCYVGERNHGPRLLVCHSIDNRRWVNPTDSREYPYDNWECLGIEKIQ